MSGVRCAGCRDDDELIDILLRGIRNERDQLDALSSLAIPTQNGTSVAISQVATPDYVLKRALSGTATGCCLRCMPRGSG
ncbi:hypothetical protein ALP99_101152 [Pseudomonas syringae pv. tomato]|uniref:Uncharacterized protein n=1 Tax=Pseudomonas syringae pv. tagetis TaxID=129140 RepID=A0A3M3Z8C2_9PSED|nr:MULTISPECIES: efflux RND transporter permease subunit [Pseudomonas syringae group]KPB75231.1 Uncharacterized protein AC505_3488 [Pseudomonas syringae pv. maculicola]RMO90958.1 hypothetical protein ALQ32_100995 [Pseudomonas syringae pv. tagetis]EEB59654.1 hypothetical protein PSPTOT1_3246 [Pseudomonas syringae pv. tomato T1]KGK94706.1 hypothetical protein NB04_15225 [Pseudomonas syringae pv. tomato]MDT3234324.1 efflux RND transporter permease subunit [Pseudomonas syringae pv. tomato]